MECSSAHGALFCESRTCLNPESEREHVFVQKVTKATSSLFLLITASFAGRKNTHTHVVVEICFSPFNTGGCVSLMADMANGGAVSLPLGGM